MKKFSRSNVRFQISAFCGNFFLQIFKGKKFFILGSDSMKKIKLGDVGEIITGKTPSTFEKKYWGKDFLFITPNELYEPFLINHSEKMISNAGMKKINLDKVGNISVLIGCIGSNIGNVGIVNKKIAFNQQINAITNFKENFDPYFIYYLLSSKKKLFRKLSGKTTMPILKKSDFESIEIDLPSLEMQKKIGNFLYSLDEKISLNKKINATLEEMAKTITPTLKIPTNFEMFQTYTKFLKNIFGFIVDGVIFTIIILCNSIFPTKTASLTSRAAVK